MFLKRGIIAAIMTIALVINATGIPAAQGQARVVPSGAIVKLILNNELSSATNNVGDKFTAAVAEDVVRNGVVLIRHGALAYGTVTQVQHAKRLAGLTGRAGLTLRWDAINTVSGRRPMAATLISVHDPVAEKEAEKVGDEGQVTTKTDKKDILKKGAIGLGAGAVLGALFGNVSRGLLLGTIGGAVAILAPKGKDVTLEKGTGFQVRIDHDLNLPIT